MLVKTGHAITSKTEVPPEQLEELWTAVTALGLLAKLTMDRDHLRDLKDLGKLLSLKTLSVSKNKLRTRLGTTLQHSKKDRRCLLNWN